MYQFNVLYSHHIEASVIHPHQGEFVVEVSASETHMSQTFWKNSDKLPQSVYTRCYIGHKYAYLHSLVCSLEK